MQLVNGVEQDEFDVVVVGSGAGGLTAAAVAAASGKRVAVFEKSSLLGGTSAVSGGMLWIFNSHYAQAAGIQENRDAAMEYVRAVTHGRGRPDLFDTILDRGDDMLRFLADECGVRFYVLDDFPDYRQDLPGAAPGGRSIEPVLFDASGLGSLRESIRWDGRPPFTMQEYETWGAFTRFPWDELAERTAKGITAKGYALVCALVSTCVQYNVVLAVDARAERLVVADGRVVGVEVGGRRIGARDGIVLATGGFEWDEKLAKGLLAGPLQTMCSPPSNEGDGLRMAQRVGAQVGNLREAWWAPMSVIPGDLRDGRQIGTLLRFERQGPGSIMVNKDGRRFANESQNYNDLCRALHSWDPARNRYLNNPAHLFFDATYLEKYGFLAHRAGQPTPTWMTEASTLAELATKIEVHAAALAATVERFNGQAREGVDSDFGRGESAYDRYWGDHDNPYPNPSMAPIETAPFYSVPVVSGAFGSSGGITTDGRARVLSVDGRAIPGLFAVGNAAEQAFSAGYPGAGATLGPIMTTAYIAGRTLTGLD
jgi:3-oxosteroid 1-dehydrogenase